MNSVTARSRNLIGDGDPSPIRSPGSAPGVLALHGFGGTPLEVELVVDVARELGLAALAPLLPGHGTDVRDLAKSRFEDWERAAQAAFDELFKSHGPLIVAGLSMGSLLAARLSARRPDKTIGLSMLANALWLTAPSAWALSAVSALGVGDFSVPKLAADIADPVARRTHLTYPAQPVHAAIEVLRAGVLTRTDLALVRCPALIAHGARDRVCPVSNARRALELLGSVDKRVVVLPRSRHIITRDLERAVLRRELASFMGELLARRRAQGSGLGEPSALE
jgi:carboxylesterase